MTKQQAIRALGQPDKVAVHGRVEYLEYEAYDDSGWDWQGRRNFRWFFVRIVDGQVEAFGDKGDFDSTKDPTVRVKIDQTTTTTTVDPEDSEPRKRRASDPASQPGNASDKFDLAAELKRLDQMKKDGILTDAEYADLRRSAIDKAKAKSQVAGAVARGLRTALDREVLGWNCGGAEYRARGAGARTARRGGACVSGSGTARFPTRIASRIVTAGTRCDDR